MTNRPRHQVGGSSACRRGGPPAARCPPAVRWNNPTPLVSVILQLHPSTLYASAVAELCRYDTAAGGACQLWTMLRNDGSALPAALEPGGTTAHKHNAMRT